MGTEPESRLYDLPYNVAAPSALRILVAEDNLTNQKVILRQLQSLGYVADLVLDGQAAVDATAQAFYHVVLMDCRLPKVDGYTATRLIRQREQVEQSRRAVIIALTANDDSQVEQEASAAGMDDFLTKPLRRETLSAMLAKWSLFQQTEQIALATQNLSDLLPDSARLALHFNLDQLHQLSDHNQEFEQELLQLYLDDTQEQLQQLLQASRKQNFLQIERTAHHIRGASASVGAFRLEAISEQLEQQARQFSATQKPAVENPGIQHLIEQLKQAFEQIQTLLLGKIEP